MNRRNLLAVPPALIGLAGAGLDSAAAAPNPDADLLAVCAEFNACDLRQRAIYDGPNAIEDDGKAGQAAAPIFARMDALLDHMEHLRAASPAGIAARAGSLAQHSGGREFSFDAQGTITGRLLDYLLRDAAALGSADTAPSVHPDAELLTLCAEFHRLQASYTDDDNPEWDRFGPAAHAAFVAVQGVTPTTEAGHRAKGRVALAKLEENHGDGMAGDTYAEFALTMLRDWLELPA